MDDLEERHVKHEHGEGELRDRPTYLRKWRKGREEKRREEKRERCKKSQRVA